MAAAFSNIRNFVSGKSVAVRFILANVAVFVVIHLIAIAARICGFADPSVLLMLPPSWQLVATHPWTLLSYMFVHFDIFHILGNMLWLYCFSIVFLDMASSRQFAVTYIAGGIAGAVAYLAVASVVPSAGLVGSSASVMAIAATAVATRPDYRINLWLFGMVAIKWIALFFVAFALLLTPASTASLCPHAAHTGGIVAGLVMTAHLRGLLRRPVRRKAVVLPPLQRHRAFDENRLDDLLDKVRISGYASLSKKEKDELKWLSEHIEK